MIKEIAHIIANQVDYETHGQWTLPVITGDKIDIAASEIDTLTRGHYEERINLQVEVIEALEELCALREKLIIHLTSEYLDYSDKEGQVIEDELRQQISELEKKIKG